jgi:hypothetical protein
MAVANCMNGRKYTSMPQIRTGKRAETLGLRRRSIGSHSWCHCVIVRNGWQEGN